MNNTYNEKIMYKTLSNGLHVILVNKKGYTKSHALFMTPFGAMKNKLVSENGDVLTFKSGLAHFLEHKMFEADNGGDVNAQVALANRIISTIIDETKDLFTLTSLGYGKRSKVEDYRLQSRGGKGIKAGIFNDKTGYLVNLKDVTDENDIMIITTGGTIIRMHADTISCIGRSTRGVRVMNVKDSEVATVDITERDDEAETQAPEETAADLSPEDLAGDTEVEEIEETVVLDDEAEEAAATDEEE